MGMVQEGLKWSENWLIWEAVDGSQTVSIGRRQHCVFFFSRNGAFFFRTFGMGHKTARPMHGKVWKRHEGVMGHSGWVFGAQEVFLLSVSSWLLACVYLFLLFEYRTAVRSRRFVR